MARSVTNKDQERMMRGRKHAELKEPWVTWYPNRPLSLSSGTSSVKRLFCGGLVGAAGGGTLGGAVADGGKGTGGSVCRDREEELDISK